MINIFKNCPAVLLHRAVLMLIIGFGCLFIGGILLYISQDKTIFWLSIAIFLFSIIRFFMLLHLVVTNGYKVIEGFCIHMQTKLRHKCVTLRDEEMSEFYLRIPKSCHLQRNEYYRFYFRADDMPSIGNSYLDQVLLEGTFLGHEKI